MPQNKKHRTVGRPKGRNGPRRGGARPPKRARPANRTRVVGPIANVRGTYFRQMGQGTSLVVEGKDCLGPVKCSIGKIAAVFDVNPTTYAGTRLSALSRGYSTYKPLMWSLHYVTQTTTTKSGSIVVGSCFGDQTVDPTNVSQLMSTNGGRQFSVWENASTSVNLTRLTQRGYHMDGKYGPDSSPFHVFAICSGLDAGTVDAEFGMFYLSYKYELSNPMVLENFPISIPGKLACTIKAGPAGSNLTLSVTQLAMAAGKVLERYVPDAGMFTGGTKLLNAGLNYLTSVGGGPMLAGSSTSSGANEVCDYLVSDTYDGEPIKLPVEITVPISSEGFFWLRGVRAEY